MVRTKIKTFAQGSVGSSGGRGSGYPCPPYKIIILDEADSMTEAAQAALRRIMETYSSVTRFCLVCNYVSRIIDPLASRCSKFRFKPLSASSIKARLAHICEQEETNATEEAIDALVSVSGGDMRKCINYLQLSSKLFRGRALEAASILELAGLPPAELIDSIWAAVRSGSFASIETQVEIARSSAIAIGVILVELHRTCVDADDLSDLMKAKICAKIAAADKALIDGADEHLQVYEGGVGFIAWYNWGGTWDVVCMTWR